MQLIFKSLFFIVATTIALLSLISLNLNRTEKIANISFRLDYLLHFLAYFALALFFILWKHKGKKEKKFYVLLISFGIFFSIFFEIIQIFIPGRVFNPLDSLFNLIGFVVSIAGYFILKKILIKNEVLN